MCDDSLRALLGDLRERCLQHAAGPLLWICACRDATVPSTAPNPKMTPPTSRSIRTKIAIGTGAVALAIWVLLAGFSYATTGLLLRASSERMFEAASAAMLSDIRSTYEPVERTTSLLAYTRFPDAEDLEQRLRYVPLLVESLRQAPAAIAIQLGDERGTYFIVRSLNAALTKRFEAPPGSAYEADFIDGTSHRFRRWFYDDRLQAVAARELPPADYDPRTRPWYRRATGAPEAIVTAPYVFFFMRDLGVTVARANATRRAVVATDVTLSSLSRALAARRLTPSSEALLHDAQGLIAWSGETEALVAGNDGTLRRRTVAELGHAVLAAAASGQTPPGWLVHRAKFGFTSDESSELVIAVPQAELLADVQRMRNWILLASFVVLALLVPLTWLLANRISTPLRELHEAIGRVRRGDFDFWLPEIRSRDEVGDLNFALRTLRGSLKQSVEELQAATAARERLESELDIARRIQMGFVAGSGRLSRSTAAAGLFARVVPARAVGGDLYDVIELPDGRLFVAVGDVSGKGVHAALLMSRVVTLSKILAPGSRDLAALLASLNDQLSKDNAECMFVTLFCAIVDARTGALRFASAGHNPPMLVRADGVSALPVESGTPLGLFEGATYVESAIRLDAGERLVVYTDGITEAFDTQQRQFGEERLAALLERIGRRGDADALGAAILDEVASFSAGAPQSDDITLLVLDRR